MTRSRRQAWPRRLAYGLLGVLALLAAGDGTRAQAVGGGVGIDPLEVLDLQVKPRVILVLDSSGSMAERPDCTGACDLPGEGNVAGDDPQSKLFQAKRALRKLVERNQDKVRFQFAKYADPNSYTTSYNDRPATAYGSIPVVYTKVCGPSDPAQCQTDAASILVGDTCPETGISRTATDVHVATDATGTTRTYHLYVNENKFFNHKTVTVDTDGCNSSVAASSGTATAPAKLTIINRLTAGPPATFGPAVTFEFRGVLWSNGGRSPAPTCGGMNSLVSMAECNNVTQITTIGPYLNNDIPVDAAGNIVGMDAPADDGTIPTAGTESYRGIPRHPAVDGGGIRAAGFTPIAEALIDIEAQMDFGALPDPKARTSVIFLTDGDDTCADANTANTSAGAKDGLALRAAGAAEHLHDGTDTNLQHADERARVKTFVIAFGTAVSKDRADWIAWAGSGLKKSATSGAAWASIPTPEECEAVPGCTSSFAASNEQQLDDALQAALDQGQTSGEYAASPSRIVSVYEYGSRTFSRDLNGNGNTSDPGETITVDPLDPTTRYKSFVPVLVLPSFDAANFNGKFLARRGNPSGTGVITAWEAGDKLLQRLSGSWPVSGATFAELHGGATLANIGSSATALIKRRILTSSRNGVWSKGKVNGDGKLPGVTPDALWPPAPFVLGALGADETSLDDPTIDRELGVIGAGAANDWVAKLKDLQDRFKACTAESTFDWAAVVPAHPCASADPQVKYNQAKKEAREMVLAFTAGAVALQGDKGVKRQAGTGEILYGKRSWLLGESTLATPAIVGPPPEDTANVGETEYGYFRDGVRVSGEATDGVDLGFGLRNPDNTPLAKPNMKLKPVMTVAYLATNQMLHALRAGKCIGTTTPACTDTGGEELWGYVPYDQLGKLALRMTPQTRDPHTYMFTTSPRFLDLFIPAVDSEYNQAIGTATVKATGKWRRVMMIGRGIAGKHVTALDITTPGPATRAALSDALVLPLLLWNRGNPDTDNGTPLPADGGTGRLYGSPDDDPSDDRTPAIQKQDYDAYRFMGQTWSIPAVARASETENITPRSGGLLTVAYMGSGYSDGTGVSTEGQHMFALDPLTGDVLARRRVLDGSGTENGLKDPPEPLPNALVGPPAAYVAPRLGSGFAGLSVDQPATSVFIGDLHGRIWKFLVNNAAGSTNDEKAMSEAILLRDLGANQPISTGLSVISHAGKAHVYVETGGDRRVFPVTSANPNRKTPPFLATGTRDDDLSTSNSSPSGVRLDGFDRQLPNSVGPGFRGSAAPLAGFGATTRTPMVFFASTQFVPAGTSCVSTHDSLFQCVDGLTGSDLCASRLFSDQLILDIYFMAVIDSSDPSKSRIEPVVSLGLDGGAAASGRTGGDMEEKLKEELIQGMFKNVTAEITKMSTAVCR